MWRELNEILLYVKHTKECLTHAGCLIHVISLSQSNIQILFTANTTFLGEYVGQY